MGYRVALIAVRNRPARDIYSDFGVQPTGQREEIAESPVCGAAVSTGWHLLYLNDYPRPDSNMLARLSADSEVVFCDANETCMSSFATGWRNGIEQWIVYHDAQQSLNHFVTSGQLPPEYTAICDSKLRDQEDDDESVDHVFDIPIDLFESLTGIRYDSDLPDADDEPFETLAPV